MLGPEMALSAMPAHYAGRGPAALGAADLARRLASLIAKPREAAPLGSALGSIRDPAAIAEELSEAWGTSVPALENTTDRELIAAVIDNHARDVAAGNFVMKNGWVLSRTEAGLYEAAAATATLS
jgi:hypothetical protein